MNSLEDAKVQREQMHVKLSKNQIVDIAYAFAQRARLPQQIYGLIMCGSLTVKRGG